MTPDNVIDGRDLLAAWHAARQRRLARLHCVAGHTFERIAGVHIGRWQSCVACRLLAAL